MTTQSSIDHTRQDLAYIVMVMNIAISQSNWEALEILSDLGLKITKSVDFFDLHDDSTLHLKKEWSPEYPLVPDEA